MEGKLQLGKALDAFVELQKEEMEERKAKEERDERRAREKEERIAKEDREEKRRRLDSVEKEDILLQMVKPWTRLITDPVLRMEVISDINPILLAAAQKQQALDRE